MNCKSRYGRIEDYMFVLTLIVDDECASMFGCYVALYDHEMDTISHILSKRLAALEQHCAKPYS